MATTQASSNRRIAKNTVALYLRMFLTMIVGFYTSRVVLNTLGVQDYGIYGVVGGVVAMMGFLNAAMAGATSRFLTFELGRGDSDRLAKTFSSALIIHMGIALVVMVLGETVGLWFLCNKLVIPPARMEAAHWVYQLSILSSMIGITQAPYDASIISHEKMNVYAYVEILNSLLKLAIVYLLVLGHFDKLKLYAVLTLAVSITIMMIYRIYCVRHFKETHFHWVWDKAYLKPLLSFSGWDLYGNMSVIVFNQGTSFLLNMFFGPALNAANSISQTVQGTIKGFAFNVIAAFRPQIIKQYAQKQYEAVSEFCILATQYTGILFLLFAMPVYFFAEELLDLWLDKVPDYTSPFLRIIIIATVFNLCNNIVNIPIHAIGKMKYFSLGTGTCFMLSVPTMYFMLKLGATPVVSYTVLVLAQFACLVTSLFILKHLMPSFNIKQLLIKGYGKVVLFLLILSVFYFYLYYSISNVWINMLIDIILSLFIALVYTYLCIMKKEDRLKAKSYFKEYNIHK